MKTHVITLFVTAAVTVNSFAQLSVDSQGKVGIGTTAPSQKLEVSGGNAQIYNGYDLIFKGGTDNNGLPGKIYFYNNTGVEHARIYSNSTGLKLRADYNQADIQITTQGKVGIGYTTDDNFNLNDYALRVYGNVYCTGTYTPSDERLKKNILTVPDGALGKILRLRPVTYNYDGQKLLNVKTDTITDMQRKANVEASIQNLEEDIHTGFVAQEVMTVFPEVVKTGGSDDQMAIDYTALIPLIIKAIQEQQTEIDALSAKVGKGPKK